MRREPEVQVGDDLVTGLGDVLAGQHGSVSAGAGDVLGGHSLI